MYDNNDDYDELTTRGCVPKLASLALAAWTIQEVKMKAVNFIWMCYHT